MCAVLPKVDAEGRSTLCGGEDTNEWFYILKGLLDCNSNHVIFLFECKECQYRFPYVGSTKTKFRYIINNHKLIESLGRNMSRKT